MKKQTIMQELSQEVRQFEKHLLHGKPTLIKPSHGPFDAKDLERQIKDSNMESDVHVRQLQRKLPPVENTERQSQQYLQKIRVYHFTD